MLIMDLFYNAFLFVGSKQHKEQLIYRDGGTKRTKENLKKKNHQKTLTWLDIATKVSNRFSLFVTWKLAIALSYVSHYVHVYILN